MSTKAEPKWLGQRRAALAAFLVFSGLMYVSIIWKIVSHGP